MTVTIQTGKVKNPPPQALGIASISLSQHLGLRTGREDYGFVGCGNDELIVYIQITQKKWDRIKGPYRVHIWDGYPVKYRFGIGPIVAFDE